jgi:hypothetical protein
MEFNPNFTYMDLEIYATETTLHQKKEAIILGD